MLCDEVSDINALLRLCILAAVWGIGASASVWLDRRLRQFDNRWHQTLGLPLLVCQSAIWGWLGLSWAFPGALAQIYRYLAIVAALAISSFLIQLVTEVIRRLLPQRLPRIFFDLTKVFVVAVVLLVTLSALFGVDLGQFFTWLFTISTIGAVVLGFALQETLGNLFAGIGLQIDAPFKLGDWIQVDDFIGEVLSLSWRATVLRTVDREVVFIPNSAVGRTNLKNFSHENAFGNTVDFGLSYAVPPSKAIRVLRQAAQSVEHVLQQPPVTIFVHHYADYAIVYRLLYWSRQPGQQRLIRSHIHQRVWYALQRAQLTVPFPIQDLYVHRPQPTGDRAAIAHHVDLLQTVDFLQACKLTQSELEQFLALGRLLQFTQNENICRVGDPGDAFYILVSGQVQVLLDFPRRILAVLQAGDYFGEMALLTGQSRTATVMAIEDAEVLAFDRAAFQMLLDAHPLAAERIAAVIAERQQRQHAQSTLTPATPAPSTTAETDTLFDLLRSGIGRIFGR